MNILVWIYTKREKLLNTQALLKCHLCRSINLRGDVVPVIDLAVRLGRKPITIHKRTCVIVIELHAFEQHCVLGLLADAVNEVIDLPASEIEDAPAFGAKIRAEFIQGIAKKDDEFIVLLDAEKTLSPIELAHLVESELQQNST